MAIRASEIIGLVWESGDTRGSGGPRGVVAKGSRVALMLLAPPGRAHLLKAGLHLLQHSRCIAHHQLHRALGSLQQLHCLLMLLTLNTLQGRCRQLVLGPTTLTPPPPWYQPQDAKASCTHERVTLGSESSPQTFQVPHVRDKPHMPSVTELDLQTRLYSLPPGSPMIPSPIPPALTPSSLSPPPGPSSDLILSPLDLTLASSLAFWPPVSSLSLSPIESQRGLSMPPG